MTSGQKDVTLKTDIKSDGNKDVSLRATIGSAQAKDIPLKMTVASEAGKDIPVKATVLHPVSDYGLRGVSQWDSAPRHTIFYAQGGTPDETIAATDPYWFIKSGASESGTEGFFETGIGQNTTYTETDANLTAFVRVTASGGAQVKAKPGIVFMPMASAPSAIEGMVYYDSGTDKLYYRNASSWVEAGGGSMTAHDITGAYHTASGLTVGNVIRASGTTTFAWAQLGLSDCSGTISDSQHGSRTQSSAHRWNDITDCPNTSTFTIGKSSPTSVVLGVGHNGSAAYCNTFYIANHAHSSTAGSGGTLTWANIFSPANAGDHAHSSTTTGGTLTWSNIFSAASAGNHTHASTTTGNTLTWANALSVADAGTHTHAGNTTGGTLTWGNIFSVAAAGTHAHSSTTTGGTLDWDTCWVDAVHTHASDAEGGTLTWSNIFSAAAAGSHAHSSTTTGGTVSQSNIDATYATATDDTVRSTTGTSYTEDTNLTVTITPGVTNALFMVILQMHSYGPNASTQYSAQLQPSSSSPNCTAIWNPEIWHWDNSTNYSQPKTLFAIFQASGTGACNVRMFYKTSSGSYAHSVSYRHAVTWVLGV